jgi:predicted protein tyrosine phosphatase
VSICLGAQTYHNKKDIKTKQHQSIIMFPQPSTPTPPPPPQPTSTSSLTNAHEPTSTNNNLTNTPPQPTIRRGLSYGGDVLLPGNNNNNNNNYVTTTFPYRDGTVLDSSTIVKVDDYPSRDYYILQNQQQQQQQTVQQSNLSIPGLMLQNPRISGADKLRRVEHADVYGVSQPSVHGVRGVLNLLRAGRIGSIIPNLTSSSYQTANNTTTTNAGLTEMDTSSPPTITTATNNYSTTTKNTRKVLWINLREEPLLYLNGRAVVLREAKEPFRNIESLRGISGSRLRELEWRFKEDIISEAARCGGSILLHEEIEPTILSEVWEAVPPSSVLTAEEVFFQLRVEGYRVRYERIPTTSGRCPDPDFFDNLLVPLVSYLDRDTSVVFNCQSGVARSTLAMTCASLIHYWIARLNDTPIPVPIPISLGQFLQQPPRALKRRGATAGTTSTNLAAGGTGSISSSPPPPPPTTTSTTFTRNTSSDVNTTTATTTTSTPAKVIDHVEKQLMAGWYSAVLQVIRLLVGSGRESKERVDLHIDACAHLVNLRNEIYTLRVKAAAASNRASTAGKISVAYRRLTNALKRYVMLILFDAYLADRVESALHTRSSSSSGMGDVFFNGSSDDLFRHSMSNYRGGNHYPTTTTSTSSNTTTNTPNSPTIPTISGRAMSGSIVGADQTNPVRFVFSQRFADWISNRREIVALLKSIDAPPTITSAVSAATSLRPTNNNSVSSTTNTNIAGAGISSRMLDIAGHFGGVSPASATSALVLGSSNSTTTTTGMDDNGGPPDEMRRVAEKRRGAMLNTDTILKLDHWCGSDTDVGSVSEPNGDILSRNTSTGGSGLITSVVNGNGVVNTSNVIVSGGGINSSRGSNGIIQIEGAMNFRRVPDSRVYGVSTLSVDAVRRVTQYIVSSERARVVHFINLREEPLIYVRDRPFVLRNVQKPFQNIESFSEIDSSRLERAEELLKRDVLEEAERCNGKVLVHAETSGIGVLTMQWEEIDANHNESEDVLTPRDVWAKLQKEGMPVEYQRIAMTPESVPTSSDYDEILDYVRDKIKLDPGAHLVFFCQRGRGRSTLATIAACLEMGLPGESSTASGWEMRNTMHIDSTDVIGPPVNLDLVDSETSTRGDFPPILSLMRVLKRGPEAKRILDLVVDKCGAVMNVRRIIAQRANEAIGARSEEIAAEILDDALLDLKRYFSLLTLSAYELEVREYRKSTSISDLDITTLSVATTTSTTTTTAELPVIPFTEWIASRPEIRTVSESIRGKEDLMESDVMGDANVLFVANRQGQVLVRGSILKTDHFPGCRRLNNPKVMCEGAPNYRSIWPDEFIKASDGLDLRIYGTGIPTTSGVREVLNVLNPTADEDGGAIWINLREEPIIYINGRPFVLRRLDQPFANLEHTGISRSRVEDMEARLKQDVLDELNTTGGRILIHEEDESGGLNSVWETVESVVTPSELFDDEARDAEFMLKYVRIPLTDEQSPKASALDAIMDIVCSVSNRVHIIFNCQMGRGRTTTGLIVAVATRLRRLNRQSDFASLVDRIVPRDHFRSRIRRDGGQEARKKHGADAASELRGDFTVVLTQVRLLEHGADAKRFMDACVDVCDAMQNLREAIYDVKKRSEAPELDVHARAQAVSIASHYLRRYVQLIQFAAYLETLESLGSRRIRFASWLKTRPELGNSLKDSLMWVNGV